ncbi:Cytochrome P450 [Tylopilus felleus]
MQYPTYPPPDFVPGAAYTIAGIVAATILIVKLRKRPNLDAIPTVGLRSWLGSLWAGYMFQTKAAEVIQEGYEKYKSAAFKVVDGYRWIVVLGGREHIEELRKAPEDALSFTAEINYILQTKYTFGREFLHNKSLIEIIRSYVTRNLDSMCPVMQDEISVAFDEVLDLRGSGWKNPEWKTAHAFRTVQTVVCRTSNRPLVGLPLCRDPDWVNSNIRYPLDAITGARIIQSFPAFLAPFVACFINGTRGTLERATERLAPIVEERLKLHEKYGNDWAGKPNDLLSWLMDGGPEGPERTVKLLAARVLGTNFAAIHSFCQALFFLAENPQHIQPLREEVESVVEEGGWSKASLAKMHKIDSFLKESQRLVGNSVVGLTRKAVKDFTFSDGTFIPKGTSVAAAAWCLHLDDEYYDNPHVFDPFRFANMRDDEHDTKHQFVSTSTEYLPFGHGKHACPGRFFAASVLKMMLAHLVMSYDVKLEDDKIRPKRLRLGIAIYPDPAAKIMFRRRAH